MTIHQIFYRFKIREKTFYSIYKVSFQRMFLHRFLFSSVAQLFFQGMTTEFIKRFLTTDIETGGEVFRIHLKILDMKKRLKPKVLTVFCK